MKLQCRFGWHPWGTWRIHREGRYAPSAAALGQMGVGLYEGTESMRTALKGGFGSSFIEQVRECPDCKRVQLRTTFAQ